MSPPAGLPLLVDGARGLGLDLSARQVEQFGLYMEMLVDWNSRINLTAITDPEGVQLRHFVDSLAVGAALVSATGGPPADGFRLVDVGTGAGFPGMPLKILWPGLRLVLADSVGKKTTFLRALADTLGLDGVEVYTVRAEEMGQAKEHRARYDAAAARAVSSLAVLCEYCLPLLKVGGTMLAPKKGDISQELQDASKAAPIVGGGAPALWEYALPGEGEARRVVLIKKAKPTPPGYPRRVGLAKQRPLGQAER